MDVRSRSKRGVTLAALLTALSGVTLFAAPTAGYIGICRILVLQAGPPSAGAWARAFAKEVEKKQSGTKAQVVFMRSGAEALAMLAAGAADFALVPGSAFSSSPGLEALSVTGWSTPGRQAEVVRALRERGHDSPVVPVWMDWPATGVASRDKALAASGSLKGKSLYVERHSDEAVARMMGATVVARGSDGAVSDVARRQAIDAAIVSVERLAHDEKLPADWHVVFSSGQSLGGLPFVLTTSKATAGRVDRAWLEEAAKRTASEFTQAQQGAIQRLKERNISISEWDPAVGKDWHDALEKTWRDPTVSDATRDLIRKFSK